MAEAGRSLRVRNGRSSGFFRESPAADGRSAQEIFCLPDPQRREQVLVFPDHAVPTGEAALSGRFHKGAEGGFTFASNPGFFQRRHGPHPACTPGNYRSRPVHAVVSETFPMPIYRVLVVTANAVLEAVYRDRLLSAGISVEVARDGDTAVKVFAKDPPQFVVLDLVLPGLDGVGVVRTLRSQPEYRDLPIFAMPTMHASLTEAAERAGITGVLDRTTHPADTVAMKARAHFQQPARDGERAAARSAPNGVLSLLNHVRSALQVVTQSPTDWEAWRVLFLRVHHVAEAIALSGEATLSRLGFAFEAFSADLAGMPDQANQSVLRTMGQAADFLAILLERPDRSQLDAAGTGRILIVDDEPGALQLICAAMEFVELAPTTAETPGSALATAKREQFDLIFLDVGLPEMSGFDLCTQLRTTPGHDRTPIVFITGMATFQNRAQSSLSGGNDFIGKPFHLLELGVKALIWLQRGRLGLT